jgi:hypothetical protein
MNIKVSARKSQVVNENLKTFFFCETGAVLNPRAFFQGQ